MKIELTDVDLTQLRGFWYNDSVTSEEEVIEAVTKYLREETPLKFNEEYMYVPSIDGKELDDDIRTKGEWVCDIL